MREHQRAPQLLVGVPDVEAQVEVHLDGLVELGALELLQQPHRLERRVHALAVDRGPRVPVALAVAHRLTSTPMERPCLDDAHRLLDVARIQVLELRLGDLPHLIARQHAHLLAVRLRRALSSRSASLMSTAGGVFVMNVNERSSKTVISTGMIRPFSCWVWALNALQNSMMLTPCWPSAGPTGGAGLAARPGSGA